MVSMRNDVLNVALDPTDNPYLMGPYAPVDTEIEAPDLRVIGEIPDDLNGLYVRNGPNPQHAPAGRYHGSTATACSTRSTSGTARPRTGTGGCARSASSVSPRRGRALYTGMVEPSAANPQDGKLRSHYRSLKDTANTDVVFHNGNLMALWYLAGDPYQIDPHTLETLGTEDWGGERQGCVSAHAKVDEHTDWGWVRATSTGSSSPRPSPPSASSSSGTSRSTEVASTPTAAPSPWATPSVPPAPSSRSASSTNWSEAELIAEWWPSPVGPGSAWPP